MEYRVEKKYLVSDTELEVLASKLKIIMKNDANQDGGAYTIRSLYFDDFFDSGMKENEAGVDNRKKFRIRTYSHKAETLYLECKEKHRGYTKKRRNILSRKECICLLQYGDLMFDSRCVLNELLLARKVALMKPRVIIEYERSAFVHPLGNVRITFDRNIIATKCCEDFLVKDMTQRIPILPSKMHVLEVKYDEYLPQEISQLLEDGNLKQIAFSKYYLGRLAVNGEFVY